MPRIVLRPRASSIVTPASSTAEATTAGQPLVTSTASAAPKVINFDKSDVEDNPQQLVDKLGEMQDQIHEELAALRSFPFTRGVLVKDVEFPGVMGQIDTITTTTAANDTVTLWRPYDAPLFATGYVIRAATSDGTSRCTIRTGSATVTRAGSVNAAGTTGSVVATASWLTGIPTLAVGDWLFRASPRATTVATDTSLFLNASVTVSHGLALTPRWYWVSSVQKGSSPPRLSVKSADTKTMTFHSTRYCVADVFICA